MTGFDRIVEQQILEAQAEGKFDNLPGRGKPLTWDENPHEPEEMRLANHILRTHDVPLPWVERGREIDAELAQARREYLATQGPPKGLQHLARYQAARATFIARLLEINRKIRDYNLQVPLTRFQRPLLQPEQELERAASGQE